MGDKYECFPRDELIKELIAWEKKFNQKVHSEVEEIKGDLDKKISGYEGLCYRKEGEALDLLKDDIAEKIKDFLNLNDSAQEIVHRNVRRIPDELKRKRGDDFGSWMLQRLDWNIRTQSKKPLEEVHYELLLKLLGKDEKGE